MAAVVFLGGRGVGTKRDDSKKRRPLYITTLWTGLLVNFLLHQRFFLTLSLFLFWSLSSKSPFFHPLVLSCSFGTGSFFCNLTFNDRDQIISF
jgi:hypothetical protein